MRIDLTHHEKMGWFGGEALAKGGQSGGRGRKRPQAERRQATALQTDLAHLPQKFAAGL